MKKALLVALVAAVSVPCAFASGSIGTAVYAWDSQPLTMQRIRQAGATFVRINVSWASVAPEQPTGFQASNPADPRYHWDKVDAKVRSAVGQGLTPYLTVYDAPLWAQKDEPHPTHLGPYPIASWKPDASARARARASASRATSSRIASQRTVEIEQQERATCSGNA